MWTVTWDPEGADELTLVAAGGFTDDELTLPWEQRTDANPRLRAVDMRNFARGSINGGISFTSLDSHADQVTAREFMFDRMILLAGLAFKKSVLRIEIAGGRTFELSEAIIRSAPTRIVPRALPVRTATTWAITGGTWSEPEP